MEQAVIRRLKSSDSHSRLYTSMTPPFSSIEDADRKPQLPRLYAQTDI